MGIDLSALVRGASKGLAAYQEGKTEAERYREQALARLFAQKLQERQQQEMERRNKALEVVQAQPRYQIITDPMTGEATAVDPRTLATRPVGAVREPKPAEHFVADPVTGGVSVVTKSPEGGYRVQKLGGVTEPKEPDARLRAQSFGATLSRINPIIAAYEQRGAEAALVPELLAGAPGTFAGAGQSAANFLRSDEQRQYRALASQWIVSVLRPESGATIRPDEEENYFRTYFRQPGDDEVTARLKQEAREDKEREAQIRGGQRPEPARSPTPEQRTRTPGLGQMVTPTPPGAQPLPKPRRLGDLESKYGIKP